MSSVNEPRFERRRFLGSVGLIIASLLGVLGWLVFILIYTLFWSRRFDLFQNIMAVVVSFLIVGVLLAVMWISYGARTFCKFQE